MLHVQHVQSNYIVQALCSLVKRLRKKTTLILVTSSLPLLTDLINFFKNGNLGMSLRGGTECTFAK